MRRRLKFGTFVPLTLIAMTAMSGAAMAQQSADQIIAALKPSGNLITGATRGIKLGGSPGTPSAPATHSVAAATPTYHAPSAAKPVSTTPAAGPSVNLTVNFPSGSADLTSAARESLDGLGKALASSDLANFRFRIEGHTDNVGSREVNLELSQRRAEAVVGYLTNQYHVQPTRLEAVGMGQESPVVDTPPQTPEARNRRVQVINLGT